MKLEVESDRAESLPRAAPPSNWEEIYQAFVREHNLLQAQVEHLRAENKMLRCNLYVLMDKDYGRPFDEKALWAQAMLQPSIEQVLAETTSDWVKDNSGNVSK